MAAERCTVGLVVVGASHEDLRTFDTQHLDPDILVLCWNPAKRIGGYGHIGNVFSSLPVTILGLCHADTYLGPGAFETLVATAASGKIAGIVGRHLSGAYYWAHEHPGVVSTLDSCALFWRLDFNLRFDTETFDSYHCCVEDFCLQARMQGIESVVPAMLHIAHKGQSTLLPTWQQEYWPYRSKLQTKWGHILPFMTT